MTFSPDPVTTLGQIAQILNQTADAEAAMPRILRRVTTLLGLKTAWVFLYRPGTHQVAHIRGYRLPPALGAQKGRPLREGACYCQDADRTQRLTRAVNIVECSRLKRAAHPTEGLTFHASVPLLAAGRPLGILNVASAGEAQFTPGALTLLGAVGNQLSIALARTFHLHQVQTRAHEMQNLAHCVAELGRLRDRRLLLEAAVGLATARLGWRSALVGTADGALAAATAASPGGFGRRWPARVLPVPEAPAAADGTPLKSPSPWLSPRCPSGFLFALPVPRTATAYLALGADETGPDPLRRTVAQAFVQHLRLALETAELLRAERETAASEERRRMAIALHDDVAQDLFSASLGLATIDRQLSGHSQAADEVARVRQAVDDASQKMRALAHDLRYPDPLPFDQTLFRLAHQSPPGIVKLHVAPDMPALSPAVRHMLAASVTEALGNALRHGLATRVDVHWVRAADHLTLRIHDNGHGFNPDQQAPGLGLKHMRERAQALGARFTVESSPGAGTTVTYLIPDPKDAAHD